MVGFAIVLASGGVDFWPRYWRRRALRADARIVRKTFSNRTTGALIGQGWVAQLVVRNEPRATRYAQPIQLVPRLRFIESNGNVVSIEGRWADSPLPKHPDSAVPPITIPPYTGRYLDVALLFAGERGLFAINNQSPFSDYRLAHLVLIPPVIADIDLLGTVSHRVRFSLAIEDGELTATRMWRA